MVDFHTTWISHRGYQKDHLENTLGAFKAAVDHGFSVLETDLRVTSDDQIVLSHDPSLMRLAGKEEDIQKLTRKQLENISLVKGGQLLFIDKFFDEFSQCSWVFDIKPEQGSKTLDIFSNWIQKQGLQDLILKKARFLVWKKEHKQKVKNLFPKAFMYAGEKDCWRAGLSVLLQLPALGNIRPGNTYGLPPKVAGYSLYKPRVVDSYHHRHAKVLAFLPQHEKDIRRALELGFDEILTDGPILQ